MKREPVALSVVLAAVAVVLSRVGFDFDSDLQAAVEVLILAAAAVFARSRVSPV